MPVHHYFSPAHPHTVLSQHFLACSKGT